MIMIGANADDHVTHSINQPTQVSLEQTDEDADVALAIKAIDWIHCVVTLSAVDVCPNLQKALCA